MWFQKLLLVGLLIGLLQIGSIICQPSLLPDFVKKQRLPYKMSKTSRELGCRAKYSDPHRATLHCLESFLDEQIHTHGSKEYKMPQSFRVGWDYSPPLKGIPGDFAYKLSMKSDSYDAALTAMFLIHQNRMESARKIVDSIVFAINNDPIGDGRTRAAYYVDDNVAMEKDVQVPSFYAKIFDSSISTRALAMQGNALIRYYLHSRDYQYMKAALKIGNFLDQNLKASGSSVCGYYGGFGKDEQLIGTRFTADNAGIYSLAKNLFAITQEPKWTIMQECAQKFVKSMYSDDLHTYMAQTEVDKDSDAILAERVTTEAIVWITLNKVDEEKKISDALVYMIDNMGVVETQRNEYGRSQTYKGMRYSNSGTGWIGESSAGAAFALTAFADANPSNTNALRFKTEANGILESLYNAQGDAMNTDGHCLVASLREDGAKVWFGNEFAGESWRVFPLCHTAATSWLGLYVQYTKMNDFFANPFNVYADKHVDIKDVEPYYQAPLGGISAFEKLSVASIVIGLLLAGLTICIIGNVLFLNVMVCGFVGTSLYQNDKVSTWIKSIITVPEDRMRLKDEDDLELASHEKAPDSPAMTDTGRETENETRKMIPLRKSIANRLSRLSTPASPRSRPMTPVEIGSPIHTSTSGDFSFTAIEKL